MNNLYRLAAFSSDPRGGNPAGVWIGAELPEETTMQRIAAEVGYSETAFVAPESGVHRDVRYFSPEMEVPFCGHATIAAGAQLGKLNGSGTYTLATKSGDVPVRVTTANGAVEASLVSVETKHTTPSNEVLEAFLAAIGWRSTDLDASIPPAVAYAGAWHLVLAASSHARLNDLDYKFDGLKSLMLEQGLITLQLVWRERADLFHSRNPFPVGGVVEDPATGAAAAALGGYLRDANLIQAPAQFAIRQGEVMGRPSAIKVEVPVRGGIIVTGSAVEIPSEH